MEDPIGGSIRSKVPSLGHRDIIGLPGAPPACREHHRYIKTTPTYEGHYRRITAEFLLR